MRKIMMLLLSLSITSSLLIANTVSVNAFGSERGSLNDEFEREVIESNEEFGDLLFKLPYDVDNIISFYTEKEPIVQDTVNFSTYDKEEDGKFRIGYNLKNENHEVFFLVNDEIYGFTIESSSLYFKDLKLLDKNSNSNLLEELTIRFKMIELEDEEGWYYYKGLWNNHLEGSQLSPKFQEHFTVYDNDRVSTNSNEQEAYPYNSSYNQENNLNYKILHNKAGYDGTITLHVPYTYDMKVFEVDYGSNIKSYFLGAPSYEEKLRGMDSNQIEISETRNVDDLPDKIIVNAYSFSGKLLESTNIEIDKWEFPLVPELRRGSPFGFRGELPKVEGQPAINYKNLDKNGRIVEGEIIPQSNGLYGFDSGYVTYYALNNSSYKEVYGTNTGLVFKIHVQNPINGVYIPTYISTTQKTRDNNIYSIELIDDLMEIARSLKREDYTENSYLNLEKAVEIQESYKDNSNMYDRALKLKKALYELRLDGNQAIEVQLANDAVVKVEKSKLLSDLDVAKILVNSLETSNEKESLLKRLEHVESQIKIGWHLEDGVWYYFSNNGDMETGWTNVKNTWYHMAQDGAMQTGWTKVGSSWYYLSGSGAMQTGWTKVGSSWYYLSGSGAMQTGWTKVGPSWYYLSGSGSMQTGWIKLSNKWYYTNSSGVMQTGRMKINNKWYIFNSSGVMQ